jgi:hypothetical protein
MPRSSQRLSYIAKLLEKRISYSEYVVCAMGRFGHANGCDNEIVCSAFMSTTYSRCKERVNNAASVCPAQQRK